MTLKFATVLLLCAAAGAQTKFGQKLPIPEVGAPSVSFTPQGTLPWLPRDVAISYLVICAPAATAVPAGLVYQLADVSGIGPLSPSAAKSLLYRQRSLNKWAILLEIGKDASLAIPVLGQSGVVAMSSKWVVAMLSGHAIFDALAGQVQSRIPDPAPTINLLLDPNTVLQFTGPCMDATMAVRRSKAAASGTFALRQ